MFSFILLQILSSVYSVSTMFSSSVLIIRCYRCIGVVTLTRNKIEREREKKNVDVSLHIYIVNNHIILEIRFTNVFKKHTHTQTRNRKKRAHTVFLRKKKKKKSYDVSMVIIITDGSSCQQY